MRNGRSRSFKVIDFGANQKRVCNFLLVISSNLGPILPRFRDIGSFLLRRRATLPHPYSTRILVCSLRLDCRCCGSEVRRPYANYSCNYLRSNSTYIRPRCINVTDRRTDRQTDGRPTIAIPRFALRASRAKSVTMCALRRTNLMELTQTFY